MKEVKLPTFTLSGMGGGDSVRGNFEVKTNSSSLPFYLGIRGARGKDVKDKAAFQGTPILMYFDIFKNYFANDKEIKDLSEKIKAEKDDAKKKELQTQMSSLTNKRDQFKK